MSENCGRLLLGLGVCELCVPESGLWLPLPQTRGPPEKKWIAGAGLGVQGPIVLERPEGFGDWVYDYILGRAIGSFHLSKPHARSNVPPSLDAFRVFIHAEEVSDNRDTLFGSSCNGDCGISGDSRGNPPPSFWKIQGRPVYPPRSQNHTSP